MLLREEKKMTKRIRDMLSQGDYANVLETAFEKYNADQLKMFRYARRSF